MKKTTGIRTYQGVRNKIDTVRLDSGFRRRDEFEASSLFVIPAPYQVRGKLQPESSGIKEDPHVYTIMVLLATEKFENRMNLESCHRQARDIRKLVHVSTWGEEWHPKV